MKHSKVLFLALALAGSALTLPAQDTGGSNPGDAPPPQEGPPPGPRGPGGPGGHHRHHPPPPPVMMVLDANHDGIIDEQEIANASAALKTLDKNGDGKLTPDELRPPLPPPGERPPGEPGEPRFHRPPGGQQDGGDPNQAPQPPQQPPQQQ